MARNNHSELRMHEWGKEAYVPGFWSLNGFIETVWTLMIATYVRDNANASAIRIDELQLECE